VNDLFGTQSRNPGLSDEVICVCLGNQAEHITPQALLAPRASALLVATLTITGSGPVGDWDRWVVLTGNLFTLRFQIWQCVKGGWLVYKLLHREHAPGNLWEICTPLPSNSVENEGLPKSSVTGHGKPQTSTAVTCSTV